MDTLAKAQYQATRRKQQLSYEYYSLPMCMPEKVVYQTENLGEVLRGDRIVNTKSESCAVLCRQELNAEYIAAFKEKIKREN